MGTKYLIITRRTSEWGRSESMKSSPGNIMDFLTVGIALLAISILVMASFSSMGLMLKKLEVSQTARKYILVMETKGCLTEDVRQQMFTELSELGLREIDIAGTTMQPVEYGDTITLRIRGKITGNELMLGDNMWSGGFEVRSYYVEETRMSTAKN